MLSAHFEKKCLWLTKTFHKNLTQTKAFKIQRIKIQRLSGFRNNIGPFIYDCSMLAQDLRGI